MKKYQIYASLLIFSFLMGVKLFMPELATSIRAHVFAVVDIEDKYTAFMEVLGDKLNDDSLRDELVSVLGLHLRQEREDVESSDGEAQIDDKQLPAATAALKGEISS